MDPRPALVNGRCRRRVRALASAALLGLAAAACGTTYQDHVIDPGHVYDGEPLVEPLPLAVGIYYGPAFRSYEASSSRASHRRVDRYHLRLGPSSIALFDRILAAQFAETRHVDRVPPLGPGEPELDAVIEVSIGSAGLMFVRYDLTLYAPTGSVIARFDADGGRYYKNVTEETVPRGLRVAMRNATAKFLIAFPDHPDVYAWLWGLGDLQPLAMGLPLRHDEQTE